MNLEAADGLLAVEALISAHRAAFRKPLAISFAVAEHGTMSFDTARENLAEPGWSKSSQLKVITNQKTLSDLLMGTFDPASPAEEHLLLWSGADEDWRTFIAALSGGMSMLDLRAGKKANK